MTKYRILKKERLVGDYREPETYYVVEQYGEVFSFRPPFHKTGWKPVKEQYSSWGDTYKAQLRFHKLEEAQKYIEGLERKPAETEVVDLIIK